MMTQNGTKLIKNSIAVFLGRLSPKIFSFLFVIYSARFLGATEFGKFVLALGYFELFLGLTARGLTIVATREIAKLPSKANEYINVSVTLGFILTIVASCILIALSHILPYSLDTRVALYLVCIALLPSTTAMIFEAGFVGFEKAQYVTYGTVIENSLRTGLWFIALILGYKLIALFAVLIITRSFMLFFYFLCYSLHISKFQWRIKLKIYKEFITQWRVIAFENWISSFIYGLDVIFLSIFRGEQIVGLYSAAYKIVNFADIGASSYTVALFPYMSRLYRESQIEFRKLIEGSLKYMLIIVIPGTIIMATIGDRIILLLFGKEYVTSIPIFSVLTWVIILRFLNPFLSHVLFARGEQGKSLRVAVISLIVYVPTSVLFIRQWGGVGAAWAVLIVATLGFCLFFVFVWRGYGVLKVILVFGRAIISSICFGITFFVLKDISLVLGLIVSIMLYCLLIFSLEMSHYEKLKSVGFIQSICSKIGKVLKCMIM